MNKKALMVWGGWDGHEPKQCVDIFAPYLREQGYDLEISDTLDAYLDSEKMQNLSLIVPIWTMGTITHYWMQLRVVLASPAGMAGWAIPSATTPNTNSWLADSGWLILGESSIMT